MINYHLPPVLREALFFYHRVNQVDYAKYSEIGICVGIFKKVTTIDLPFSIYRLLLDGTMLFVVQFDREYIHSVAFYEYFNCNSLALNLNI